jgi:hypothetical protein
MKNLFLVLTFAMLAAGCSSGTTVADLPSNVTNSFRGTFQNTPGTQRGTVIIDIQDVNGVVSGNIIFTSEGDNCLRNSAVNGSSTGFNLNLVADQTGREFTSIITEREAPDENGGEGPLVSSIEVRSSSGTVGTFVTTLGNGNVVTRVTTVADVTGNLNMQFTIANSGSTISGTYTTDGSVCSNGTGAGSMNLSR